MVRDVYAGDEQAESGSTRVLRRYRILADVDPMVIGRIAQQLAYSNAMPSEFRMIHVAGDRVEISVTLAGVAADTCEFIRRKIGQLSLVHRVAME